MIRLVPCSRRSCSSLGSSRPRRVRRGCSQCASRSGSGWGEPPALVMVCSLQGMQVVLRGIEWSVGGGPIGMPDDLPPAGPTAGDAQLWGSFRVAGAARGAGVGVRACGGVGACGGSQDGRG